MPQIGFLYKNAMQNPFELIDERLSRIENKLEFILNQLSDLETKPESDVFYSVQETAQFLKLSVPTIYGLTHNMQIPVHKGGKRRNLLSMFFNLHLKLILFNFHTLNNIKQCIAQIAD